MLRHWSRSVYYVIGKGLVEEPDYLSGGCPHSAPATASTTNRPSRRQSQPIGKYGLMFRDLESAPSPDERCEMINILIELGRRMNVAVTSADPRAGESSIPAGYTYLGQFIAHEVSFDKTRAPQFNGSIPNNYRSPQIDLDSLYGGGPTEDQNLYQDRARLKIGETVGDGFVKKTFLNDLPRRGYGSKSPKEALIADPRNDDNLALAQTHLAFAKFHNAVVDKLQRGEKGFRRGCPLHPNGCPPRELFNCARREVCQHFQAIILEDFLPRILHSSALEWIQSGDDNFFKTDGEDGVFMPLEFSAAAFRFGHSMVRSFYEWNYFQCSEELRSGPLDLTQLFEFTNFSGDLGRAPRLKSDWIIDWRRFYDFEEMGYPPDARNKNKARKIDTAFNLHLDLIPGYPHKGFEPSLRSITVRNLLRGYSLGLPSGESVAERIGHQMAASKVADGLHKDLLNDPILRGKTPLWYYVLREAEQEENNGRLGPVGSRIVAETLVGLIKKSPHSILNDKEWLPKFGDAVKNSTTRKYRMIDLLDFADTVDPLGDVTPRYSTIDEKATAATENN